MGVGMSGGGPYGPHKLASRHQGEAVAGIVDHRCGPHASSQAQ